MRFNRDFELIIVIDSLELTIRSPLRIAFDGNKSISGGLNKLNIQIYNLKESNRLALVKDKEEIKRIPLFLKVGYKDSLQSIFKGTIHQGRNSISGPDRITNLECLDGGVDFLNSFTSRTVKGKDNAIDAILSDMPNTGKGKITKQNILIRPKVLVGNSANLIDEQINSDETWYIENEQLFIIKNDEVVTGFIPEISAKTGLINTPEKENQKVSFETMMNPTLIIGGQCKLVSKTAPHLNSIYKVESLGLKGDNYGSDWKMSASCLKNNNFVVL